MVIATSSRTEPPLVVELRRGSLPESEHLVHVAVVDTDGAVVRAWGDAERLVHPRSSIKPIQALPLVQTGAAEAFGLSDVELALACSSHRGETAHLVAVEAWLARIGSSPAELQCGTQDGRPGGPVGHNCSGKHAGFLTVARHLGVDLAGYIGPEHPVQRLVTAALAAATGEVLDPGRAGTDGCGIPVHPVPLRSRALSAARYGSPDGHWPDDLVAASRRLAAAMVAEPWYVAGTDRMCTELLAAAEGEVVVKVGAEGVQWAALPRLGLGIAVKVADGDGPASEIALGHVLAAVEGRARDEVFGPRRRIPNAAGLHVADLVVRP